MSGYDYINYQIDGRMGKFDQLIWFLVGNGLYYLSGIILAFTFKKKRAFCKIVCPVSYVMKAQTRLALIKKVPTGEECTECNLCNLNCPMDVDVMNYIANGKKITSTECILCSMCSNVCPVNAIK